MITTLTTTTTSGVLSRRELSTEILGPRSTQLHTRRSAAVSSGVSSTLPVYVERVAAQDRDILEAAFAANA